MIFLEILGRMFTRLTSHVKSAIVICYDISLLVFYEIIGISIKLQNCDSFVKIKLDINATSYWCETLILLNCFLIEVEKKEKFESSM